MDNAYVARVHALAERSRGRDEFTPPQPAGNRYYPGSEKIHGHPGPGPYAAPVPGFAAPYTAPVARWRR